MTFICYPKCKMCIRDRYLREPLCGCAASCSRVSMTNHLRLRGGEGDERDRKSVV